MNIIEKVSYIKGLAEGMKLDENTNEGKLIAQMLDVLQDMAHEIDGINGDLEELYDAVGEIDEDVAALEEDVYGGEHCGCGCEDEDDMYEITCPKCGNSITVDFGVIAEGGVTCPNCGEELEFDLSELDEEED